MCAGVLIVKMPRALNVFVPGTRAARLLTEIPCDACNLVAKRCSSYKGIRDYCGRVSVYVAKRGLHVCKCLSSNCQKKQ